MEAAAWDEAGNVMRTTTGGGLEFVVEGLVASFLAFLGSPEIAGGVLRFFVGFGKGPCEDLMVSTQPIRSVPSTGKHRLSRSEGWHA